MEVGIKEVLSMLGIMFSIVTAYVTVRVMLGTHSTEIKNIKEDIQKLEDEVREEVKKGNESKEKLADGLNQLAIVLGKVEQKLDDLDKNVMRIQDRT